MSKWRQLEAENRSLSDQSAKQVKEADALRKLLDEARRECESISAECQAIVATEREKAAAATLAASNASSSSSSSSSVRVWPCLYISKKKKKKNYQH